MLENTESFQSQDLAFGFIVGTIGTALSLVFTSFFLQAIFINVALLIIVLIIFGIVLIKAGSVNFNKIEITGIIFGVISSLAIGTFLSKIFSTETLINIVLISFIPIIFFLVIKGLIDLDMQKHLFRTLLWGAVFSILFFVLAVIFVKGFSQGEGIFIAGLLLLSVIELMFLSAPIAGIVIGRIALKKSGKNQKQALALSFISMAIILLFFKAVILVLAYVSSQLKSAYG